MYVVSAILFVLPCALLGAAWNTVLKNESELPGWRRYAIVLGLAMGIVATSAAMAFVYSWFHNGGSFHGLDPAPGAWQTLRPVLKWALLVTVAMALFGKGKGRILLLASAVAYFLVVTMLFILEME